MLFLDLIAKKRDGGRHTPEELAFVARGAAQGLIPDYQLSAWLMAVTCRGMDEAETVALTRAMANSGETLGLGKLGRKKADKHSTGGVGDGVSLALAPLAAACGLAVPMMSGRGLGHTGGTLDKLESIPGWRASLSNDEIRSQLESVGAVVCAAGAGLAPVDRRLYALRDVTATVESVPLIASSIMSKKIAEGTDALVLDVKVGRGAFIKDLARARELASTMVGLGASHGVATVAQLTAMDAPLGRAVGNAIEVNESVDVLKGAGPSDVRELTLALARIMLELVGLSVDPATRLDDGSAYEVYCRMIRAQGGDPDAVLALGAARETIVASESGTVQSIDALAVGRAAWHLGAGRARKEDAVSAGAGVLCLVVTGDRVSAGQPLFELLADDEDHLESGRAAIANALVVGSSSSAPAPLLIERVDS